MMLAWLLVGTFALAFSVRLVSAQGETIHINSDGSVTPSDAPVLSLDNVTYTLTSDVINGSIVVERDNVVVDGAGYTVQAAPGPNSVGIDLTGRSNVTVKNMNIIAFVYGIYLSSSLYCNVGGNNMTKNAWGIFDENSTDTNVNGNSMTANSYGVFLSGSSNDTVTGNSITNSGYEGLYLFYSSNSNVSANDITANQRRGVWVDSSLNNSVDGNNVTGNGAGVYVWSSSTNNSISRNSIEANSAEGVYLFSASGNSVSQNDIKNNSQGVSFASSSNNSVSGNNITANTGYGLHLYSSSDNNSISGNSFFDDGLMVQESYANVVVDNLVNGKPLVYLENVSDYAVKDAGQVVLVNCDRMTVENLNLANASTGVELCQTNNTIVSGNNIKANNSYGVYLTSCLNDTIRENNITDDDTGVTLDSSSNNSISGNTITASGSDGVLLISSATSNDVSGNYIANNVWGIELYSSSNNTIYHNNFVNNTEQAAGVLSTESWDPGYPSGGNYWSDYKGTDSFSGAYQNATGSDGIGDTRYVISSILEANNTDNYPLMGPFSDFRVADGVDFQIVSNSTVSDFQFNGTAVLFNVSGMNGTTGFCHVRITTSLLNGSLTVLVNGTQVQYSVLPGSNSSASYLYFNYGHSTEQVVILPEFRAPLILASLMLATLLVTAIRKKSRSRSQRTQFSFKKVED